MLNILFKREGFSMKYNIFMQYSFYIPLWRKNIYRNKDFVVFHIYEFQCCNKAFLSNIYKYEENNLDFFLLYFINGFIFLVS